MRVLLIGAPFAAIVAVAVGLHLGAADTVRAAVVFGAPPAYAGTGLAWQIVVADQVGAMREPIAGAHIDVVAHSATGAARWRGQTNADGVAEIALALGTADGLTLHVSADGVALAEGQARAEPPPSVPGTQQAPFPVWMPFARRTGSIAIDVAVLGQRVAPGFAASVLVRATDGATTRALAGVTIDVEPDASLASAGDPALTDANGWALIRVTPVGLAVALRVHAWTAGGPVGDWEGGLYVSPGAASLQTRLRWSQRATPTLEIAAPPTSRAIYLEVDNERGRAWADFVTLPASADAKVDLPALLPGLYWAVAAADAKGATTLGPGTAALPFFVAESDAQACAFGVAPCDCGPAIEAASNDLVSCLATAPVRPVARWVALDGFAAKQARTATERSRGLAIAVGALIVAALIEAAVLLRAAVVSRVRMGFAAGSIAGSERASRALGVAIALLVAVLGFALLAAFLVQAD